MIKKEKNNIINREITFPLKIGIHNITASPGDSVSSAFYYNKKQLNKVPMLIGNGSGHEPIAVGWIGEGMLDANIVGDIFSAPSGDLIFEGIKIFKDHSSILLLISNHSGDVMNGEMAIEMAEDENINAKCLIMYDDIASAPKGNEAQRRGGAGTTFVYKILGALSEKGADIQQLLSLGKQIVDNTRTLSVAISPGTSPITGVKVFRIVGMKKPDLSGKKTTESQKAAEEPTTSTEKTVGGKNEEKVVSRYYRPPETENKEVKKPKSKKPNSFCEECGSKIAAKDMFCTNCGAKR